MPIDVCRRCLAAGPDSIVAEAIRGAHAKDTVDRVKVKGLEHFHPLVQVSVMGRFMSPTEADQARLAIEAHQARLQASAERSAWDGVPYPKRLIAATAVAGKAFRAKLRSYKGCGCLKVAKKAVKAVIG